jgi:hypothetical protein
VKIESALIAKAQPQMASALARDIIRAEIRKGCRPDISPLPVSLEPRFRPLWVSGGCAHAPDDSDSIPEEPAPPNHWTRFRIWISPEHGLDWNQSELFVKQLQVLRHRSAFGISGNKDEIKLSFLVLREDAAVLRSAFNGEYNACELSVTNNPGLEKNALDLRFRDYYPPPPYSHLLTRPQELQKSPLMPLITAMADIDPPAVGIYQVVFQAVPPEHNWHRNVQILLDFEYNLKLQTGMNPWL